MIEKYIINLYWARKLKELGCPQISAFSYDEQGRLVFMGEDLADLTFTNYASAYLRDEIVNLLPKYLEGIDENRYELIGRWQQGRSILGYYLVGCDGIKFNKNLKVLSSDIEGECYAQMIIWLVKNSYIVVKNNKFI